MHVIIKCLLLLVLAIFYLVFMIPFGFYARSEQRRRRCKEEAVTYFRNVG